jgi:hypothetical protein
MAAVLDLMLQLCMQTWVSSLEAVAGACGSPQQPNWTAAQALSCQGSCWFACNNERSQDILTILGIIRHLHKPLQATIWGMHVLPLLMQHCCALVCPAGG